MEDTITSGTEAPDDDEDQAVHAPYGVNPKTGKPYKRDPAQMAQIRAQRGNSRGGSRGPAPARGAQPSRPATGGRKPPARKRPEYGAQIARAVVTGSNMFLADPVEQAIMRHQGAQLAVVIDRMLDEDPRMLRWVEKLKLRMAGGAKGDALMWLASTGGLIGINRGFKHPLLFALFGATLDQVRADAVRHEQQQAQARAEMADIMAQYAAEEGALLEKFGNVDQDHQDHQAMPYAGPLSGPLAQFGA